jgi:hypothetical protein
MHKLLHNKVTTTLIHSASSQSSVTQHPSSMGNLTTASENTPATPLHNSSLHLCTLTNPCAFFNPLQLMQLWHLYVKRQHNIPSFRPSSINNPHQDSHLPNTIHAIHTRVAIHAILARRALTG